MDAIKFLLDDKKLIKYIHGPPGTGKSYLALWIAIIALMFAPPTTGADDEWGLPLDLGPQVEPEEYDKLDLSATEARKGFLQLLVLMRTLAQFLQVGHEIL